MVRSRWGTAVLLVAEKSYFRKVSKTFGLRPQAGMAVALFLLASITSSGRVLTAQQQSNAASAQEQNASSKEVDQLRKEVGELREDLKRLHALLESRATASESASAPAPQPSAAVQPAIPSADVAAQAAKPAPGETGVPQYTGRSDDPAWPWQQRRTGEICPGREISCARTA